ncbi:hypothetical protein JCM8208_004048 [Rhodotorula glutinis]
MRILTLVVLCCACFTALALAEPAPRAPPLQQGRRVVPFGNEANLQRDRAAPAPVAPPKHGDEASNNYLITLDRFISNRAKDDVLDKLMDLGVVVKTAFDYRVYKGYLVSVPATKSLADWQPSLLGMSGVKAVEVEQAVKTQANGKDA